MLHSQLSKEQGCDKSIILRKENTPLRTEQETKSIQKSMFKDEKAFDAIADLYKNLPTIGKAFYFPHQPPKFILINTLYPAKIF